MTPNLSEIILRLNLDPDVVIILLFLPLIVSIITLARHVIGLKSLGIYAPIVLTFMFYEFGLRGDGFHSDPVRGLKYGIFLALVIFTTTAISYKVIQKWALHYYSKISIVITVVVLALISLLVFADLIGKEGILTVNVFSLILIATVSERYLNLIAFKKSSKTAVFLSLGTLILASLCYLIISWSALQDLLLEYPLLILLNFPISYVIGRFSGLRVSEYYRFREILDTEE